MHAIHFRADDGPWTCFLAGLLLASTSISARADRSGLRARTRQEPQAHGPMMRSTSDGQSWADTAVHGGGRPRVNAWLASMKRQFAAADRSSQAQIPFLLVSHSSVRGFAMNLDAHCLAPASSSGELHPLSHVVALQTSPCSRPAGAPRETNRTRTYS